MSTQTTADKVIGNRLRVNTGVLLEANSPGSGNGIFINEGRLTPPVFSWVTDKKGDVFWMFNELGTPYYLRHSNELELVQDEGGASFLEPARAGLSLTNVFDAVGDTAKLVRNVAIGGLIVGGGILAWRLWEGSKTINMVKS
ncbi:MAG: hypothetical protein AAFW89_12930 [Bacteroidota bacterium]